MRTGGTILRVTDVWELILFLEGLSNVLGGGKTLTCGRGRRDSGLRSRLGIKHPAVDS